MKNNVVLWPPSIICLLLLLFAFKAIGNENQNPVEVGAVKWLGNYEEALAKAEAVKKPVFLLFQEVPGCSGCKQFGKEVLSNPKLVKIIEAEFIPMLVHNNKGGEHARILKKFKEPAWNFQVVRFIDAKGNDIIPRKDKIWSTKGIAARMIDTLKKLGKEIPDELLVLAGHPSAKSDKVISPELNEVAFAMYCFWTGEARLGTLEGVIETEAGFMSGHEVTKVKYDPSVISYKDLYNSAKAMQCASAAYKKIDQTYHIAPKSDQKRQIANSVFMKLGLNAAQLTKVNSFARTDLEMALSYLTEDQLKQYHEQK